MPHHQCINKHRLRFSWQPYIRHYLCNTNSGGIAYLIDIATSAKKANQKIKVTGLSDHFEKIFQMVGLTRCMELGE